MAKKVEFNAKNVKAFTAWLKKFSSIDQSLLLEIDQKENMFCAKVYNEERSVVKYSQIRFDEAGLTINQSADSNKVKVGIYNISRLMKVMDHFNNDEFTFTVNYDEINNDGVTEFAGVNLILKNKTLKFNIDCTSLNIFKYISSDLFNDTIAFLDNVICKFEFSSGDIDKTNSLCSLDSDYKFMEFKTDADVHVAGKTFDLIIGKNMDGKNTENSIDIFKDQFNSIDLEDYNVQMGEDKLVFNSSSKNTTIVISRVEKDS